MQFLGAFQQVAFGFRMFGIGQTTFYRAHRLAGLVVVKPDAFRTQAGVDDVNVGSLADGLVRAFRLASPAVNAFLRNECRHV